MVWGLIRISVVAQWGLAFEELDVTLEYVFAAYAQLPFPEWVFLFSGHDLDWWYSDIYVP